MVKMKEQESLRDGGYSPRIHSFQCNLDKCVASDKSTRCQDDETLNEEDKGENVETNNGK